MINTISRTSRVNFQQQKKQFDLQLFLIISVLVGFGLVIVYDASTIQALRDFNDSYYYIRQQIIWAFLGFLSLFIFANFDYRRFKPLAFPMMIFSLLLLVAVFIPGLGVSGGGAHRWLRFGPVSIQPAEIIKLTGVIFLATLFEKRVKLFPFVAFVGIVSLITAVFQKDLGSTIVFALTSAIIYFYSNAPMLHFLLVLPVGIVAVLVLIFISSYRLKRVLAFLNPFSDTQGFTYHISQVLIALGSGGLFGLGLSHSRQKFEYIPEVTTDSIFGIVGEELGFAGAMFLIMLFVLLVFKGLKIAQNCSDSFGKILAVGLVSWLGVQVVINLSSMVALMPLTGVPLPFISYGGSALVANLTAVGILLNISKQA